MRRSSGRLLITLVLLAVASAAAWVPAQARPREGARWVRSYVSVSVTVGSRPGLRPASGEPDAGGMKTPPQVTGRSSYIDNDEDPVGGPEGGAMSWFSRIGMIWMARYLGVR